jgi:threonine aldolase
MAYAPPPSQSGLPPIRVNLYSDTQTKPTPAMRAAMMEAEVGDEQSGLDPTINALCDRMAALMGKEAAVFLPSGTMCNQIAILTHCRPGDAVLAHESAHILAAEGGAAAALAGVQITPLPGPGGQFDAETVTRSLLPRTRNAMPQTLLSVEQTANLGGGTIWPRAALDAVAEIAHAQGMATHMDGARLMNAVVATGIPAATMAAGYDSVWLDFTKGLGAPVGAVLCGSAAFIDTAWRWKQRLGGALRQGGICAAGCLHALDHHIGRLAEDHALARRLAEGLGAVPGLKVQPPQTNLVFIDCAGTGATAEAWAALLRARGVLISVMGETRLRACTHLDVSAPDIEETIAIMRDLRPMAR